MDYQTVDEFIKEFRQRVGDSTCDIPASSIITWTNTALRRLARSRGLDKLFTYHDTFELARLNNDGTPATTWKLQGLDSEGAILGMVIDVQSVVVLDNSDCCMADVTPCYMPFRWFRKEHPFPEREPMGDPCAFTISQLGGITRITFARSTGLCLCPCWLGGLGLLRG